jgi:hypothetical protein
MARKPKNKMAENIGDFAGPDADRENIEKLAKAAEEANAKAGHNSGEPPDEVIKRNADAIEVSLVELDAALKIVQGARAALKVSRDTAKTDLGSKAWVDSIVAAVKLKREASKGGSSSIVAEHRQMGRVLRLLDTPLGVQFGLYSFPDMLAEADKANGMDAELQGQHAWSNNEPLSNNPFTPGTEDFVAWETGHNNAMAAHARKMGPGEGAAH